MKLNCSANLCIAIAMALSASAALAQQPPVRFGGSYASLGERRQHLIDDWVGRFVKVTGQQVAPEAFYDGVISLSTKTTFEAVTHALMTTALTDLSGANMGDGLALVAEVDGVRGEVPAAAGDHQFRIYVRLVPDAMERLERSQQFKRGADNAVYHKGYPINYRAQGGVPSIQFSISTDRTRADIDVDYRSSGFPAGLFNGHLTSSNSDVRAGSNFDRHVNRWTGFENWWRGFFGIRQGRASGEVQKENSTGLPRVPRAGKTDVDLMAYDFLKAWLIEGDIRTAMGYVSERAYACVARDSDDPAGFDFGLAPFQLMANLKAAHEAIGPRTALEGLVVGTHLVNPALRVVRQPHHAQIVVYAVPDDVAAAFDCERRLTLGEPRTKRIYGNYFGSSFYIDGPEHTPVALLWARERGYWKIVSWSVGIDNGEAAGSEPAGDAQAQRVAADPTLVKAAHDFLDQWLIRRNYDAAFAYLAPAAYGCYNLERSPEAPAATSPDAAGRLLRANFETAGKGVGAARRLDALVAATDVTHPAARTLNHSYSRIFALASIPNAMGDVLECEARASGKPMPDPLPSDYGSAFGMTFRFKTQAGEAPILGLLWRQEQGAWRITSYRVELP